MMIEIPITDINVSERHRKNLGDIDALAESISDIGLLHPVVVSPDHKLLAGKRRLLAAKKLGWEEIPVTVMEVHDEAG